jgi:ISXO2-like transposase domain/Transposase zinc-ribbon domain
MNLSEVHEKLATTEQCLEYLTKMRWPDGVIRCTVCGNDKVVRYERPATRTRKRRSEARDEGKQNSRPWFYICQEPTCRNQFSPTSGTLFHDSHLPLIKWFQAIALVLNAKKGISAMQLKRDLGVSYKTAWYLYHRIREIMAEGEIPKLGGIVEIDETYIGGRVRGKTLKEAFDRKQVVVGAIQRKGNLKLTHTKNAKVKTVKAFIESNISPETERVMTDQAAVYPFALADYKATHETVNHIAGEYVRGDVYTNTIESVFSLFKRGIIGQYHKISGKHLQRYLDEFSYRYNRRKQDSFHETVARLCGFGPLTFASLISDEQ